MMGLGDHWLRARDRLLSDPRFQRWAAAFPLTRPIARRRAMAAFDLCAGFVYSQILYACIKLDILEKLRPGPRPLVQIASELDMSEAATLRLLLAAQSLGLVARRSGPQGGGHFGLGSLGAALLANPGITRMIEHHALLYQDLADPISLLRSPRSETALSNYWAYARTANPKDLESHDVAGYTSLMSSSQTLVCAEILNAYDFSQHRCLLDVGGGDGTFLAAVAQRTPDLSVVLFDLPAVAQRASARFTEQGIAHRARAVGGSFLEDELPRNADIVSLVRVLHDHDDDVADMILRKANRALGPGGRILIAEPLAETPGAERVGDAYFGFYLLAMRQGRARTAKEITAMLHRNGFSVVQPIKTRLPLQTSIILARS